MNKYLELEYPYYSYSKKFNKKEILNNISTYKPTMFSKVPNNLSKLHLEKFNNAFFILKEDYLKTENINSITDYFTEKYRVKCKFGNFEIPFNYWQKHKKMLIDKTIKKYGKLSISNLREIIYSTPNIKLCNNFRITVALTILNHFKPAKWLDISAGWGDRLLSALFYKTELYVGCDPNIDLHPEYQKMIKTFAKKENRENFQLIPNGFLEAKLPNEKFDIVMTSPPFFKLEIYSKHKENSVSKFDSEKDWINYFFIPSLIKAYNYLKKDGHIVLYMGGSKEVFDAMFKLNDVMKYKGIIYFYEKTPRAIYVWQKIKDGKINRL